jgi:hypothetical protein
MPQTVGSSAVAIQGVVDRGLQAAAEPDGRALHGRSRARRCGARIRDGSARRRDPQALLPCAAYQEVPGSHQPASESLMCLTLKRRACAAFRSDTQRPSGLGRVSRDLFAPASATEQWFFMPPVFGARWLTVDRRLSRIQVST